MERNCYKYRGKEFDTEQEALNTWLQDELKQYYSIQKYRNEKLCYCIEPKIITTEQLQKIRDNMNSCEVHYKGNNKVFNYKDMTKIDINNLNHIILMNIRGINNNIAGATRIVNINNILIKVA